MGIVRTKEGRDQQITSYIDTIVSAPKTLSGNLELLASKYHI